MDELESMLIQANQLKNPVIESIDLYYNDLAQPSEAFVVKVGNIANPEKTRHFRRVDFFQGLKDAINHLNTRNNE